ncbi:MAG: glycoside hydrolase/phage tail family protein [Variibacter sp.]|nr:glycoside hydrolase/phage tail family protein [Variibacter sp.]
MAALVLSLAGAAAGSSLFGPFGAIAGRIVGAVAGSLIDQALFGGKRQVEGPRLADLDVMASSEGAPIPRVYGRARLSGQVIWATRLEEVISTRTESAGGKGLGPRVSTTTYSYFANFAVGLCEGPIAHVARIWADGKPLDLSGVTVRVYQGTEDQMPDALILAKQGADGAPAYRGLAYVVFERLPLEKFGNRIPQLSFEVIRPLGRLERMVRAVTLIPGTTEFGYEPAAVTRALGPGASAPENRHLAHAASDIEASLDELQALCPNLERVAIVVAWFGTDLRAQHCRLKPGVELREKTTHPLTWSVAGLDRATAHLVSTVNGRPAYGGTPSDASVVHLIAALRARGLKVTLYPFVMMDVPPGNALPDPWTGAASQPPYPWRGRITCDPAPGQPGSPDGTAAAEAQIDAFFGTAAPGDFAVAGDAVLYAGPEEWTLRRMVLHYAHLAAAAGGVDAFVIGSELKALTRVRSGPGIYPAVAHLVALARDVKAVLGSDTIVTYAADWTEYGAHVVDPNANEVRFPLDPLWASPAVDVVGIDYYAPLADWRDGAEHLDRARAATIYDRDYLAANLRAGEGYDWFYADAAARRAQARAPITDGAAGKPWVFRVKDLWSWWANAHFERTGGAELQSPTAWIPQSKPLWLTEVGCPAVDKGANQPSVFPDPKSVEGGVPHFSNGSRDDLVQRRYLEAVLGAFDPAFGASVESNPISPAYGGRMIDPSAIHLWTWDARPYPAFPAALDVWSDGPNWETGHWLNGRLGAAPLDALVAAILADSGVGNVDTAKLVEAVDGYVIDRPMAPRAALEPLALAYAFDAVEDGSVLSFRPRGGAPVMELTEDDLVLPDDRAPAQLTRAQETELPREVSVAFTDAGGDFRRAAVTSRRLVGGSARAAHADLAVVTTDAAALRRAEIWLQDLWAGRETASFALGPSKLALAPGDVVGATIGGRRRLLEVREIVDTESRAIRARAIDPEIFDRPLGAPRRRAPEPPAAVAPVHAALLELPTLRNEDPATVMHAAVFASPWPGAVAIWRSADGASFERLALAVAPAVMGETLDPLPRGPANRWDRASRVRVRLYGGALASVSDMAVLTGANAAAVRNAEGAWEVLQFANAVLVGERTYELSRLLRGVAGSEWAMTEELAPGAPFVLLDEHLVPLARGAEAIGRALALRIVAASRDHADPAALALSASPAGVALRPLAPVHIRGVRKDDGVHLSWRRRARRHAFTGSVAVPLDEPTEAYAVDILSGRAVVRSFTVNAPRALYAAADEAADFGAPQASLSVRVAQLSATVGRGIPAEATINHLA